MEWFILFAIGVLALSRSGRTLLALVFSAIWFLVSMVVSGAIILVLLVVVVLILAGY